jgi:DNA replication protein DnaC
MAPTRHPSAEPATHAAITALASVFVDRIAHNAHRIELAGESMRKRQPLSPAAAST